MDDVRAPFNYAHRCPGSGSSSYIVRKSFSKRSAGSFRYSINSNLYNKTAKNFVKTHTNFALRKHRLHTHYSHVSAVINYSEFKIFIDTHASVHIHKCYSQTPLHYTLKLSMSKRYKSSACMHEP